MLAAAFLLAGAAGVCTAAEEDDSLLIPSVGPSGPAPGCGNVRVTCAEGYVQACVDKKMTCRKEQRDPKGCGNMHVSCADGYDPVCVDGKRICRKRVENECGKVLVSCAAGYGPACVNGKMTCGKEKQGGATSTGKTGTGAPSCQPGSWNCSSSGSPLAPAR
jgi:hypothetical protein